MKSVFWTFSALAVMLVVAFCALPPEPVVEGLEVIELVEIDGIEPNVMFLIEGSAEWVHHDEKGRPYIKFGFGGRSFRVYMEEEVDDETR